MIVDVGKKNKGLKSKEYSRKKIEEMKVEESLIHRTTHDRYYKYEIENSRSKAKNEHLLLYNLNFGFVKLMDTSSDDSCHFPMNAYS